MFTTMPVVICHSNNRNLINLGTYWKSWCPDHTPYQLHEIGECGWGKGWNPGINNILKLPKGFQCAAIFHNCCFKYSQWFRQSPKMPQNELFIVCKAGPTWCNDSPHVLPGASNIILKLIRNIYNLGHKWPSKSKSSS